MLLLMSPLSSCHFDFILDTAGVIVPGGALLSVDVAVADWLTVHLQVSIIQIDQFIL